MIALLQRVRTARVEIEGRVVATIGCGTLALIGVRSNDDPQAAARLLDRLLEFRMFADDAGKMNLNLPSIQGGLLLVPQFTLAADTRHGRRPGFSSAATRERASQLFALFARLAAERHSPVVCGVFGAHMQVSLTNDGPVTFWLES